MRKKRTSQGLTLRAIAGTHVVLLGFDLDEAACAGLLGFAIHRTDHTEDEAYWLEGLKTFAETDPGLPPGAKFSTREHPIQGFGWSDLSAKPGHDYTYRVVALKGSPQALEPVARVSVRVRTESEESGDHDVFFNRGAAASQEYARRFQNRRPDEIGKAAYEWLSRGLSEAMEGFIGQALGPADELRVCAYELHYPPVLQALADARARGATVRIVYDRRKANPGDRNEAAVAAAGLASAATKRRKSPSAISHNKFVVHLRGGAAQSVLTGGTNFSEGGIFGHSNCVHVVQNAAVAERYRAYWDRLAADPETAALAPLVRADFPLPSGKPPKGTTVVASPRRSLDALDWWASLAAGAKDGLFMTFAFGIHPKFQDVYRTSSAGMRYALLEKATRPMAPGPARDAEEKKIRDLRFAPENRFAIGAHLKLNKFDRWLGERLSGLNHNVQYLHTKYLLIDPLGPDPIVVTGSANFSAASVEDNDENMLVVRGNRRIADIYVGEFMRLYNHYAFREWAAKQTDASNARPQHLRTDDWWRDYFGETPRSRQREYFAHGKLVPAIV